MQKDIILHIDTSSNLEAEVSLKIGEKKDLIKQTLYKNKTQVVLPLIEKLLLRNGLKTSDLTDIEVILGPGSFTGLRVGVSIANSLGSYLKIPINGKPIGMLAEPEYS